MLHKARESAMRLNRAFLRGSLVSGLLLSPSYGCKSSSRDGDSQRATLTISLTGLQPDDEGQYGYTYQISGCIPTAVSGSLVAQDKVSVTAAGLTNGLSGCNLAVKSLVSKAGVTVTGSDPSVLYQSTLPALALDINGHLTAVAALTAMFNTTGSSSSSSSSSNSSNSSSGGGGASSQATNTGVGGSASSSTISVNLGGGSGSPTGTAATPAAAAPAGGISINAQSGTCPANTAFDPTTQSCH